MRRLVRSHTVIRWQRVTIAGGLDPAKDGHVATLQMHEIRARILASTAHPASTVDG